jgi:predicted amidohydrolase
MKIRVSAVQYDLHTIHSFDEFAKKAEHYIKLAEEYGTEFILFPELFTTQLMSIGDDNGNALTINDLPGFTEQYLELFSSLAKQTRMHIIGGTHVVLRENRLYNVAHLFYPDGKVAEQAKLHMTPPEINEWNMAAGESIQVFETSKVRAKGADIIFVPSCTYDRHGFHRVRYTSHARAIENQVYVVLTGTVGSLPTVDFMRSNFGQAAIITPNDVPFPPRGLMAEGEINQAMIVTADLDLQLLYEVRESGSVTTWRDRRTDLYTDWK